MARPRPGLPLLLLLFQAALGSEAPQFMLDLYRAVAGDDGVTKGHGLPQGNTVRSFLDKSHVVGAQGRLLFRLSGEAKQERVLTAELHLFRLQPQTPGGPHLRRRRHFGQVSVFQVRDPPDATSAPRKRLLCSRLLSFLGSGWEVFPVTQAVHDWTSEEDTGLSLVVVAGPPDLDLDLEPGPDVQFASGRDHHPGRKPMLVLFAQDDSPAAPLPSTASRDLSVWPLLAPPLNRTRGSRSTSWSWSEEEEGPVAVAGGACRRLPLVLDVEDLGWGGWVISPRGVGAFQCRGGCPFPLGAGLRPSNHAVLRSIARALRAPPGPRGPPAPCCVPDALLPINLLYFDGGDRDNVVLKEYPDMVAASCGCR